MSFIGGIFHGLLTAMGGILAFFYSLIPNYAFAISMITILIMLLLVPINLKQTRSMIQMQKLAPEMKKLQQKWKGPENRLKLQEEMMALYKEHGANPMSGCLPMVVQLPVLGVMYYAIRGLLNVQTHKTKAGAVVKTMVNGHVVPAPKYIPHSSALYQHLVAAHGKMVSLGIDLAQSPKAHHSSVWAALPFYALVLGSAAVQYVQMRQQFGRNQNVTEQNPQMQSMQRMSKMMPLLMIFIYVNFPAALSVYFLMSGVFRLVQQELMFRFDPILIEHVSKGTGPGSKPASKPPSSSGKSGSSGAGSGKGGAISAASKVSGTAKGPSKSASGKGASGKVGTGGSKAGTGPRVNPAESESESAGDGDSDSRNGNDGGDSDADTPSSSSVADTTPTVRGLLGRRPPVRNGKSAGTSEEEGEEEPTKSHPRSKSKRPRKQR